MTFQQFTCVYVVPYIHEWIWRSEFFKLITEGCSEGRTREWSPFLFFWLLPTALPVLWSFRAFEELYQCIQAVFAPRCFIHWSDPDPWTDLHPPVLCFSCCVFWGSLMISSFFYSHSSKPTTLTQMGKKKWYNHKEIIIFTCGTYHLLYSQVILSYFLLYPPSYPLCPDRILS